MHVPMAFYRKHTVILYMGPLLKGIMQEPD